jgi:integrase
VVGKATSRAAKRPRGLATNELTGERTTSLVTGWPLRATGIRLGELLDLELDGLWDTPRHGTRVKVPVGKLDTKRTVPLDEPTLAELVAGNCTYANICEQCENFVTSPEFTPALQGQLAGRRSGWYMALRRSLSSAPRQRRNRGPPTNTGARPVP